MEILDKKRIYLSLKAIIFASFFVFIYSLTGNIKLQAAINNTIDFQTRITNKTTGLTPTTGTPSCVSASADTCDFRIRIWNLSTGGTATAGNNLLYEELFTNIEIGDYSGRLDLKINSVCGATLSSNHSWGTTGASATVCNLFDDNGDADSTTGVNFDRTDLYFELTFDPSGTWTTLASPPGGIETFTRTELMSVPTVFDAQRLSGMTGSGFVQLSPSAVQNTNSTTAALWMAQLGTGNILQLQKSGTDFLVLDNNLLLQLSQTGSTGGLLIGGDANLYRSATNTLKTDNELSITTNLTDYGLSNFQGDLRGLISDGNASSTTSGTGTSTKTLVVGSTTGFDPGNLVLINGTTYARVENLMTSSQMRLNIAVSWSAGQTVQEKILPFFGDSSSQILSFDKFFLNNSLRVGQDSNGTTYKNGVIDSPIGLAINSPGSVQFDSSGSLTLNNTNGINITKNQELAAAGSWSTGAPGTIMGRASPVAVVYQGKMYVWGGLNSSPRNFMSIYDFESNTWTSGTSGGTARSEAVAVTYGGKIYIWGGTISSVKQNIMDIYDIATDSWSTGATGGTARTQATAVQYNGKMYSWAGVGGANLNTLDIYDIATNTWSTGATGGTARSGHVSVLYNGRMYSWGGATSVVDIYDIATNTWSTGTTGPTARNLASAVVYLGKMYIWAGSGSSVNTLDIYDIASNTWSTGTAGGTGRNSHVGVLYNGKMYNWGGAVSGTVQNTMDIYTFGINDSIITVNVGGDQRLKLDTNNVLTISGKPLGLNYVTNESSQFNAIAWSTGTSLGAARGLANAAAFNNKIYVWGGFNNNALTTYSNAMDIYDIATNTWGSGTAGGTPRSAFGSVVYNSKIYYFEGCLNSGCTSLSNAVDIYNISTDSWTTGTSGGTARGGPTVNLYSGKVYIWAGCTGGACTNSNTLDIYDIPTDSWTTGTAGGTARRNAGSSVFRGKIYNYAGLTTVVVNTLDIYDITTGTWSTGTAGGTARSIVNAFVFNDKLYSTHGFTTVGVNTTDVYDIITNTWTTGLAGGTADYGTASTIVGSNIYLIGGINTGGTAIITTVDILNLGTKPEDIFYITNNSSTANVDAGPDSGKLFRFDATGRAYTSKQGGWFAVGADYAEYMHTEDTSIESADIVSLDPNDGKSIIKAKESDTSIVGVISTEPGFVGNITTVEDVTGQNPNYKLMSMVGQVPVKVRGDINVGDRITASDLPGVGRKAKDGEVNVGIAQESHYGDGVDLISLLITRNNDGINNKVQIVFGKESEGGFRVSDEGKMQFKDKDSEWKNIADSSSITEALLWEQKGDNVFSIGSSNVAIGLESASSTGSRLQVGGDFESRDGLNYVKVSASGKITFNQDDIGFRVNELTNAIEFKDNHSNEWKALSGLLISRIRFNNDTQTDQLNQMQFNGWGYIESDNINSILTKSINFPESYQYQPIISLGIIGQSSSAPENASDCSEISSVSKASVSEVNRENFKINLTTPVEVGKYYCYTWLAN